MSIKLKEVLKERGLSVTDLANRMNEKKGTALSRVSISNIVNGVSSPKVSTLENIAEVLEVNICDLFKQEGIQPIYMKDEEGNFYRVGNINE